MRKSKRIVAGIISALLLAGLAGCRADAVTQESTAPAETATESAAESAEETKDCCADGETKDCCKDKDSVPDCCEGGEVAASAELEKTTFEIGHLNSTAHLLVFVAKEEGYFEEEGLQANLTLFSSAGELATGLESGKLDVALIGSVPTLTFLSQGHDLTVFGGAMTNGLLKGRNVASVKNSVQDAELQILLKNANLEIGEGEDKVNIVYFDSQKDAYAALANNTIDAASVYSRRCYHKLRTVALSSSTVSGNEKTFVTLLLVNGSLFYPVYRL